MAMAMTCLASVQFNDIRSNRKWLEGKSFYSRNSEKFSGICKIKTDCNNRVRLRRNYHVGACAAGESDGRANFAVDVRGDGDDHDYDKNRNKMSAQQLDHWLENSVVEIVKNIGEAPLLVQVYTENEADSSTSKMKVVIEKTTSKSWHLIKQRWESSFCTMPNGIILVEQLESKDDIFTCQQKSEDKCLSLNEHPTSSNSDNERTNLNLMNHHSHHNSSSSNATKLWGVLVQGREINFPLCYLLKTCQVQCCFGLSTHFCLAKVDCFGNGKGLDFHFNKMWLQR